MRNEEFNISDKLSTVSFGKCMWDKSARLVLVRTIKETGQSSEFIIFEAEKAFTFRNDDILGTVAEPFVPAFVVAK